LLGGKVIAFSEEFKFSNVMKPLKIARKTEPVKIAACWRDDIFGIMNQADFTGLRRNFTPIYDPVDEPTPRASSFDTRLNVLSGDLIQKKKWVSLHCIHLVS